MADEGWANSRGILLALLDTPLGPWFPEDLLPWLVFLDTEINPKTGEILEAAVLVSRGLLGEPHVEAISRSSEEGGFVAPSQVSALLSRAIATGRSLSGALGWGGRNCWLVGHNIIAFELPGLRERGVRIPDIPVIDTLELSLITEPLRSRHSLDAEHTAEGDERANLKRFEELDAVWLSLDPSEFLWHMRWNPPVSV